MSWLEDFCIGFVVNRFVLLVDIKLEKLSGGCVLDDLVDFGYMVYGFLVFVFLIWMLLRVIEDGICNFLFLSCEGYLLIKVFELFVEYVLEFGSVWREYFFVFRFGC